MVRVGWCVLGALAACSQRWDGLLLVVRFNMTVLFVQMRCGTACAPASSSEPSREVLPRFAS